MEKKNCWEVLGCGRQPGGDKVDESGPCPASLPGDYDGVNNGEYAGRFCWAISGTFCNDETQGTYATKLRSCLKCDFLNRVNEEEGSDFILTPGEAGK